MVKFQFSQVINFEHFYTEHFLKAIRNYKGYIIERKLNHLCINKIQEMDTCFESMMYLIEIELHYIDDVRHYSSLPTEKSTLLRVEKPLNINAHTPSTLVGYDGHPRRNEYYEAEAIYGPFKKNLEKYFNMVKNKEWNFEAYKY